MNPTDVAIIQSRIDELDPEGAAREIALLLRLDQDATDLIGRIIHEAMMAGRHEATVALRKEWSEEDWS